MNLKRFFFTALIYGLLVLLVGCSNLVSKNNANFDDTKNSDYYLSNVELSSGSVKTDWQLLAIQALVKENKLVKAKELLSKLPAELNSTQQNDKLLSQGEIAIKARQSFNLDKLSTNGMTNSQLYRYYTIKFALDGKRKDINAQIHDYVELEKFAPEKQKKQVINNTWNFLSKLNIDQMRKILVSENESILQGWVDLMYIYQDNNKVADNREDDTPEIIDNKLQRQKEALKQAVIDWSVQYSSHPATIIIPILTGDQTVSIDNVNTKKVALLLPLNGSSRIFGETIRQGYWDAIKFFPQEPQQDIVVLDTTITPIDNLIQQAQEQNVDLIVGPLLKDEVTKIKQLAPSIPVLALNKTDDSNTSSNKMCFFSLSPEDEAKDAAEHIFSQNKLKPLLLVPQNELGHRVAQSFAEHWTQLSANSSQVYVQYLGNAKTLSVNMNRNSGISLTGEPILINDQPSVLTNPNDNLSASFDAVYIYSSYDELTLIKPMLDMGASKAIGSGTSKVTLYSSSKSHVANASNDFYYDMDQTEYADIPMIIDEQNNTNTLPNNIQNDYSLMRLYAMGIDAWRLANRFNQLDSNQPDLLTGMTGKLSTTAQCEITRSLSWQQYNRNAIQSSSKSE